MTISIIYLTYGIKIPQKEIYKMFNITKETYIEEFGTENIPTDANEEELEEWWNDALEETFWEISHKHQNNVFIYKGQNFVLREIMHDQCKDGDWIVGISIMEQSMGEPLPVNLDFSNQEFLSLLEDNPLYESYFKTQEPQLYMTANDCYCCS